MINDIPQLVQALGGDRAFGKVRGAETEAKAYRFAYDFKRRNSIPVIYWPRIIEAGRKRGVLVDVRTLVFIHTGYLTEAPLANELRWMAVAFFVVGAGFFLVGLGIGFFF
jgi:hypothetical protein